MFRFSTRIFIDISYANEVVNFETQIKFECTWESRGVKGVQYSEQQLV